MRRLPALLAASAVVATLAACAPTGPAAIDGCTPAYGGGATADLVEATGAIGSAPEVSFPTPLATDGTQRATLVPGEGDPLPVGSQLDVDFMVYSGATGAPLGGSDYDPEELSLLRAGEAEDGGLPAALACARVGERFAVTITAAEAYGPGALAANGVADEDTLAVVFDVRGAWPGKADGVNQLPDDGMPAVATAVDGTPGITVPDGPAPAELRVSAIKLGDGPAVEEGDEVVLQYTGWTWPADDGDPTIFDSTWTRPGSAATSFVVAEGQLIPGFVAALVGATVGSQVLAVIPSDQGYDDGVTRVFVVDVLGIVE